MGPFYLGLILINMHPLNFLNFIKLIQYFNYLLIIQ